MTPHRHQLPRAFATGVGEPEFERTPQGALGRAHRRRRVACHFLRQRLRLLPEALGWVDDLADHAELVRPFGGETLVATDERHAHDGFDWHVPAEADR